MWLKQIKHPTNYVNTLKHRVEKLDSLVYHKCIHHLQFNIYNPKFVIKFLTPTILPIPKIRC